MKRIREMTEEEIRNLMHNRIRPCWRRLPIERYDSPVLTGLWDMCRAELNRRERSQEGKEA